MIDNKYFYISIRKMLYNRHDHIKINKPEFFFLNRKKDPELKWVIVIGYIEVGKRRK